MVETLVKRTALNDTTCPRQPRRIVATPATDATVEVLAVVAKSEVNAWLAQFADPE